MVSSWSQSLFSVKKKQNDTRSQNNLFWEFLERSTESSRACPIAKNDGKGQVQRVLLCVYLVTSTHKKFLPQFNEAEMSQNTIPPTVDCWKIFRRQTKYFKLLSFFQVISFPPRVVIVKGHIIKWRKRHSSTSRQHVARSSLAVKLVTPAILKMNDNSGILLIQRRSFMIRLLVNQCIFGIFVSPNLIRLTHFKKKLQKSAIGAFTSVSWEIVYIFILTVERWY